MNTVRHEIGVTDTIPHTLDDSDPTNGSKTSNPSSSPNSDNIPISLLNNVFLKDLVTVKCMADGSYHNVDKDLLVQKSTFFKAMFSYDCRV